MHPSLRRVIRWIRGRAENIVAVLLALMFAAFIIQIVFRYFFNFPIGWTSELSVITWLYMVLIGSAFWLTEREEIRFDLVSSRLGPKGRRVIGLVIAMAALVLFALSLPASWKYVTFMKVESSSYMKIRLDLLYSIYLFFAVALIARYAWDVWRMLRGEAPEEIDVTKTTSGL
jgi:TRAP-type C4-dicarboxylate transport system permease small subunit